eukprot:8875537-Lingulodinium_polyedra.AAC.1
MVILRGPSSTVSAGRAQTLAATACDAARFHLPATLRAPRATAANQAPKYRPPQTTTEGQNG